MNLFFERDLIFFISFFFYTSYLNIFTPLINVEGNPQRFRSSWLPLQSPSVEENIYSYAQLPPNRQRIEFLSHYSITFVLTMALTLLSVFLGFIRAWALTPAIPSVQSSKTPDVDLYAFDINKVILELIVPDPTSKPSPDSPYLMTATTRTLTMTTDLVKPNSVVLNWNDDIEGSVDSVERIGVKTLHHSGSKYTA